MSEDINGQPHDRTALFLYGSETGNSQDVAEDLGRLAERLHFETRVCEMDAVEIVCHLTSISRTRDCPCAYPYATEHIIKAFCRCFHHLNHRPRRVPEECEEVLEKSSEEAFASWMS
jgi:hypothetical protein